MTNGMTNHPEINQHLYLVQCTDDFTAIDHNPTDYPDWFDQAINLIQGDLPSLAFYMIQDGNHLFIKTKKFIASFADDMIWITVIR